MPDDTRKPVWDKTKLPSRHSTSGPERAPHRAMFYAMGVTEEQLAQPIVGVATTWNEAAPCNISLSRQAQSAKDTQIQALNETIGFLKKELQECRSNK